MKKGQNCVKSENLCSKIHFTEFLLINIVDQILKIYTIVETLVTVLPTTGGLYYGLMRVGGGAKKKAQLYKKS